MVALSHSSFVWLITISAIRHPHPMHVNVCHLDFPFRSLPFDWIGAYGGGGLIHVPSGRRICLRSDENSAKYCSAGITLKNLRKKDEKTFGFAWIRIQLGCVECNYRNVSKQRNGWNGNLCKCFSISLELDFAAAKPYTSDWWINVGETKILSVFGLVIDNCADEWCALRTTFSHAED